MRTKLVSHLWLFMPPVAWTILIYTLSSSTMLSGNVTESFVLSILREFFPAAEQQTLISAHYLVRKIFHFTEFGILALLWARAFRWRRLAMAAAISVGYAMIDEFHQRFVSDRVGAFSDVVVDSSGILVFIMASYLMISLRRRRPDSPSEPAQTRAIATTCPACNGEMRISVSGLFDTRFGAPGHYSIARCGTCLLEMTLPLPQADELPALYERYYNSAGKENSGYKAARNKMLFSWLYRLWMAIDGDVAFHARKGTGRLLDLGCNEGRGLEIYANNGFQAEGVEINSVAADVARERGFQVFCGGVQDYAPAYRYDVVVLSNVVEHVTDPSELLGHANRLLKDGGEIWISCPNSASWQRSLFGKRWINWHVPFHLFHFSPDNISHMLRSAGFGDPALTFASPALWSSQSLITGLFARPGEPARQMRNPMLIGVSMLAIRTLLFPLLWLGNRTGKGDCMLVTAVKVSPSTRLETIESRPEQKLTSATT